MGCCQSTPSAPDVLIPDPLAGTDHHFVVKSLSVFNSDYAVYKESVADENKWLFLNKAGSGWNSGKSTIDLENFVRNDPENAKQGEVLWRCNIKDSPHFEDHYDSDSSSDGEFLGSLFDLNSSRHTHKMKWKMEVKIPFEPVKNKGPGYMVKCKSKGYAKRRIRYRRGEDGRREKYYEDETKIKKLSYKIRDNNDFTLDKFKLKVDGKMSNSDLQWESNAFHVQKEGGFMSDKFDVHTKGGGDPGLALILGHVISTELTPKAIVGQYHPNWRGLDGYFSDYESDSDHSDHSYHSD